MIYLIFFHLIKQVEFFCEKWLKACLAKNQIQTTKQHQQDRMDDIIKEIDRVLQLDSEDLDSIPNEGEDITEGEVYGLYVASENPEMGGVKIILVAEAIEGFEFVEWSDGNTSNPRIIELTEDTELYARFKVVGDITNVETSKISVAEVYSRDGVLYVEGAESDYHVLDMAGRLIYSGRESALNLPRGVYLVTIAGEVEKVVI